MRVSVVGLTVAFSLVLVGCEPTAEAPTIPAQSVIDDASGAEVQLSEALKALESTDGKLYTKFNADGRLTKWNYSLPCDSDRERKRHVGNEIEDKIPYANTVDQETIDPDKRDEIVLSITSQLLRKCAVKE